MKKIQITEETKDKITDIDIKKLIPNCLGGCIVTIFENHHTIVLPDHATGTHWKTWCRTSAGIFSKDVLNFSLNKPHGKYVLIKQKDSTCVARLITEEEKLQFDALKLIDDIDHHVESISLFNE